MCSSFPKSQCTSLSVFAPSLLPPSLCLSQASSPGLRHSSEEGCRKAGWGGGGSFSVCLYLSLSVADLSEAAASFSLSVENSFSLSVAKPWFTRSFLSRRKGAGKRDFGRGVGVGCLERLGGGGVFFYLSPISPRGRVWGGGGGLSLSVYLYLSLLPISPRPLSVRRFVCLSVTFCLAVRCFVCLSVALFVCHFLSVSLSVALSVSLSLALSVSLPVTLSVSLSVADSVS